MARLFDGATDRIDYANVLNPIGQAQTFSAWAWFDDITPSASEYIWHSHANGDGGVAAILFLNSPGPGELAFFSLGGTNLTSFSNENELTQGAWQHILYTWDGSVTAANVHMYVNGSEVGYASQANGVNLTAATGSWTLGARIYDDARNLTGRLASPGFWNRILDAGEITSLAVGYSPWMFPFGLVFAPDLDGIRGGADDHWGDKTASLDGTSVADHPTNLIYPRGGIVVPSSGGAPAANTRRYSLTLLNAG